MAVSTAEAQAVAPAITFPTDGQALQGQVTVMGTTGASNFGSAELDFAYAADSTNSWFVIQTLTQPVTDGALATWDTTKVTDGAYVMRLRVFGADGAVRDAAVNFEIANYTLPIQASPMPSPSNPPALDIPGPLPVTSSSTPTSPALATPTPLPPNPAALSTDLVYQGLGRGALVAFAAIVVLGAFLLRRRS